MKKIIYLFALFSCVQIVLAQQDSSYFPLQVGNYWVLQDIEDTAYTFKIMIEKDTVMPNNKTYSYIPSFDLKYFREGDSGNIYCYIPQNGTDILRFKFNTKEKEEVYYYDQYNKVIITRSNDDSYICFGFSLESRCFRKYWGIFGHMVDFTTFKTIKAVINNICVTCNPQVGVEKENFIPETIKLYQNYPNPFNPETKINFEIPETGLVKLKVFSITGQEINSLVDETKSAGSYSVIWDGKDKNNLRLSSGVYFYQLAFSNNNNQTTSIKKMIFTK